MNFDGASVDVYRRLQADRGWFVGFLPVYFVVTSVLNKNAMENVTLNRVELKGRVGQDPKIFNVRDTQVAKFSVATNETFHDRNGDIKEETTWHNVSAWTGRNIEDFRNIRKGTMVSVEGRIRNTKFTGMDGNDRYITEVVASKLALVNGDA